MTPFNLIPLPRRRARRVGTAIRRWASITAGYGVIVAAGLAFAAAARDTDHSALDRRLDDLNRHADNQRTSLARLNAQIDANQRKLAADKAVSIQPDWSILLALLPRCLGDDAALRRLSLQQDPRATPPAAAPEAGPHKPKPTKPTPQRGFTLKMTAVALSQATPNNVVVSLEESGLFDRVKLLETRRETAGKTDTIVFEIECRLAGAVEAAAVAAAESEQ